MDQPTAPLSAQELLTDALERYAKARTAYMGDSSVEVPRVAAMAAVVQAEQLTRIADSLDKIERALDSAMVVGPDGATFLRTWPGRT